MTKTTTEPRVHHAVLATPSEWERIRRLAQESGMELSRFIVHRASVAEALPPTVLRRAVRELLVLAKIEERRVADLGAAGTWAAVGAQVDAWLDRELELDRLTDLGAAERWRAVAPVRPGADDLEPS